MCLLTILINLSGFWKYWFDFTMSLYIIGKNLEKTLQEIKHLIKKKTIIWWQSQRYVKFS